MLAIVGFGYSFLFFAHPQFDVANWQPMFQNGTSGFLTAVALMTTMFFGFEVIPQFAEEANYPAKKHWKLMVGAIVFVMAFDGAITLSESGMLPFDTAILTPMLGAEIASVAYGPWLQYIIVFANVAALCGCLVGFWMGGSRMLLAMGRSGALPSIFAKVNKNKVPSTANVFILGVVLMFILLSGSAWLSSLFTLMAVGVGVTYTGVSLAFIKLRITGKEIARPWKVPGGMGMGFLALFGGLVISYFTFAYFTVDVWMLFVMFFALVGVVRLILVIDSRKHPEKYGMHAATVETIAMAGIEPGSKK
jgi:amino acid transporter